MRALVFAPLRNAHGKRDADEFAREAQAFLRYLKTSGDGVEPASRFGLETSVAMFDNTGEPAERRAEVLAHLQALEPGTLDVLAFACHGWPDGIQAGFRCEHARGLAREVKAVAAHALTVVLYCCSTGADQLASTDEFTDPGPGGDGGFADRLRDELADTGVAATVYAHSNAGHCTRNPRARVFRPGRGAGGHWLVAPGSKLWPAWTRYLKGEGRFRFPFLTQEQLEAELSA